MTDMKKWLRRISSLLVMGISVLILVSSFQLGIGDLKSPGPGFTSFLASALGLLLSLFVFFMEMMGSRKYFDEKASSLPWNNLVKPVSAMFVLLIFTLLLKSFGYPVASFFLMFGMFFIYNPKKWNFHILTAAVIAVLSFLIFHKWLKVYFPSGDIFPIGW